MAQSKIEQIYSAGVSVWLDSLSREMIDSGWLKDKIVHWGLRGQTSNPTIFEKAASHGNAYDEALKIAADRGQDKVSACWDMMISDVQRACDLFHPVYEQSHGEDGYVSLELDPTKAGDTQASITQGHELWKRVGRANLMIKVPATKEGLPVIAELLASGYNVNVTLLFSVERYREVMEKFLEGFEKRAKAGQSLAGIASVASFFVSRVDGVVDKALKEIGTPQAQGLVGKAALANAQLAYEAFEEVLLHSERFKKLQQLGAQIQRPLWASTSTKDPNFPDTLYVDGLIGPHCVNTLPEHTIEAALDHAEVQVTLNASHLAQAKIDLKTIESLGIDMNHITNVHLIEDGVTKFMHSYDSLLAAIGARIETFQGAKA